MSKPWTAGPHGASGTVMDEKSPQDRKSGVPNKTRRARKKTNGKRVRSARASAFARAADVVAGVAKPPPQVGARKPPASVVAPADAGPAPSAPAGNIEQLANNFARRIEESGKAAAAYLKPREEGQVKGEGAQIVEVIKTLGQVAEYWLHDPQRTLQLQTSIGRTYLDLWASAMRGMAGAAGGPAPG